MGIKYLNKFLLQKCKKSSIRKIHFSELSGKTIVIDTSIYLYKFAAENALLENFYVLISLFRKYDITPVFIFDGRPPIEKRQLLIQRRIEKREAEEKYTELQKKLELLDEIDDLLLKELEYLKKQSTMITYDNIQNVKDLMTAYGVTYICAEGEADTLCVQIAKTNAWGCMSDDMDMFVYGCPRVFRNLNMANHTLLYYDTQSILKDLNLDIGAFREIAVLSGTDYSTMKTSCAAFNVSLQTTLQTTYTYYTKYKKSGASQPFYEWLVQHTNYIDKMDCDNLYKIIKMFMLEAKTFDDFCNKTIDMTLLKKIMHKEGFLFLDN
jgi:hypothetical protein